MYHIKEDGRTQKSAERIRKAMMDLFQKKPFEEITVSDIQKISGVGRATFYRLFDNTADVLEWMCVRMLAEAVKEQKEQDSVRQRMLSFIRHCMENETLVEAVFKSGQIQVFYRAFEKDRYGDSAFWFSGKHLDTRGEEYLGSMAVTAMIGGLSAWVRHQKRETPEELYEIIRHSLAVLYRMTR